MSRQSLGRVVAVVVVALLRLAPAPSLAQNEAGRAEIDRAIARGTVFLKDQQTERGEWTYTLNHDHELGITALAGLALLENGVPPTDSSIARADEVVRVLAKRSDQTYDLSLAILFLGRVRKGQTGETDALIRRLADRLAGGGNEGFWGYNVPLAGDDSGPRSAGRLRRFFSSGAADNSNTQFALLGLWAASRHGFDANEALREVDAHFRETRGPDGRWGYTPGDRGRDSMTCAGLMGLAIASSRPALAERQTARARGAALAADPVFVAALKAVAEDAHRIDARSDIYYLWSLERVCVALGLRDLDGFDWYGVGSRELLRRQQFDGGWPQQVWGRLPNTCLALLFLRKANLAFELDRVLRLPGAGPAPAAKSTTPSESDAAGADPTPVAVADGGATVVVTGASDADFPRITVDFEVKKADGSYVVDATREDFRVTEDGASVPIVRLQAPTTREARPITVVLVVDRSRSMEEEDRIGGLKRAVGSFLDGLPKGSRVSVIAFGSEVQQLCPFTGDFARVREAVERLTPAGATRYYDAVAESLELLHKESGRRAVLALTDGEDTFSQDATLDSVILAARRLGLPVHTLGLGTEEEIESDSLRRLARSTRGEYYPARQADQLRSIYEQLAERLRSSYTLVYQTDRKLPDGTLRPVRVSYRAGSKAGETAVFIPGMVVPAAGWSRLFLALLLALVVLGIVPRRLAARRV